MCPARVEFIGDSENKDRQACSALDELGSAPGASANGKYRMDNPWGYWCWWRQTSFDENTQQRYNTFVEHEEMKADMHPFVSGSQPFWNGLGDNAHHASEAGFLQLNAGPGRKCRRRMGPAGPSVTAGEQ